MTNSHRPGTTGSSLKYIYFFFFCFVIVVAAIVLIPRHHKLYHPKNPNITLMSCTATTLSETHSATWHLTIAISNPNRPSTTVYFKNFTLSLFYNNHAHHHNDGMVLVASDLDHYNLDQPVKKDYNILLSSKVSFSTQNLGGKDVVEKFLNDQKKGSITVSLAAYFILKFDNNEGSSWKTKIVFCDNVVVSFKRSSHTTWLASDLPKPFYFM